MRERLLAWLTLKFGQASATLRKSSSVLEEISQHPTDLPYISSGIVVIANRPKNIRIHLAIFRVRFHLLRFNFIWEFLRRWVRSAPEELPIRIRTTSFRACGIGQGSVASFWELGWAGFAEFFFYTR